MEEAQRLLTVSVWKLYRCRVRRGGLRLHRSLQLSLLVRAARHRYLSARAAAETRPGPELTGAAVNGATPGPELTGAAVNGAIPGPEFTGAAGNGATPGPELTGAAVNGAIPGPELTGAAGNGATPGPEFTRAAGNGATPAPGSGSSGDPRCPSTPIAERPDRATPRTEQEWGNPCRDWTGDHRNPPSGAPRSEWDRGCPPGRPSENPPSPANRNRYLPPAADPGPAPDPPNRDRGPPPTADPRLAPDPPNRDPPPAAPGAPQPTGALRAGQKRRSSGSAGPGRGPVPSKRARLEAEAPPLPPGPPGRCSGPPAAAFGFLVRAVGAC